MLFDRFMGKFHKFWLQNIINFIDILVRLFGIKGLQNPSQFVIIE